MKVTLSFFCCVGFLLFFLVSCKDQTKEYIITNETNPQVCNLSNEEFNSWFNSGSASNRGIVMNANSLDFIGNVNCDFYKWSEQMFLWITSMDNDQTVLESPIFYTISPLDNTGQRRLIPHSKGVLLRAMANVDKTGSINTEEGQATDDVLMDRNGNLVYYISFANDVYAQFLTATKNGKMSGNTFPTTAQELDSILSYARESNTVVKDSNALAIELKTSWIIADSLESKDNYITIDAIIPTYKKTNTLWVVEGEKQVQLAMVGIHIVGSTAGHPEMIWATFEHKNNTPNLAYQYLNEKGNIITVPADGDGDWIFNSNVTDSANISHMTFKGDSIIANNNHMISASNTTRTKPWGSSYDTIPNSEDKSPADANTKVIAINDAISELLPGNDVRKEYLFLGATWTDAGTGPNGKSYSPSENEPGVAIGSSQLANSTMETYFQHGINYNEFSSCFTCHSKNSGLKPGDLSHVFTTIVPLTK